MNSITLISIFITTVVLTFLIKRYAHKLSLIDIPNERSMHKKLIPRGAGIAFILSIFISLFLFDPLHLKVFYYIYLSIALVWFAGVLDDVKSVSPKIKFIFIFIASIFLFRENYAIFNLGTYFGFEIILPTWFAYIFTFFAIAGYTNALNLMDGLDGLAASITLVMLITFFAIGIEHADTLLISLSSFFISSLLAFLIFNWYPAKIFMGDSGSLTLGFVIAILTIQASNYISPAAVLFIIALPLLDTFIVMTRRKQRGKSLFEADKNHLHHFLFNIKGDVKFTVIMLVMMQGIFSIIGFQVQHSSNVLSILLFILLFYIYLNMFDQRLKRRKKRKY
jgi:UDP-GlcNAc:undecaprenyl-phosphate GlcNAc-1-phosphate transferase